MKLVFICKKSKKKEEVQTKKSSKGKQTIFCRKQKEKRKKNHDM